MMQSLPNFNLTALEPITTFFRKKNIVNFHAAIQFIQQLPYGRNSSKTDLSVLFKEQKGTCSTKHAVLRKLALEHQVKDIQLMLGLYKMNASNTPKVAPVLEQYGLAYLPEAHNYLAFKKQRFDFTVPHSSAIKFEQDILLEFEIEYTEIGTDKIQHHQSYIKEWMKTQNLYPYSFDEIWHIRETCITALSQ